MPSRRNVLLRTCAPLIEGKEKLPMALPTNPPPPPPLWSLLTLTTPGVMVSSSVKLRPFRGSSTTSWLATTVPNQGKLDDFLVGDHCAQLGSRVFHCGGSCLHGYTRLRLAHFEVKVESGSLVH